MKLKRSDLVEVLDLVHPAIGEEWQDVFVFTGSDVVTCDGGIYISCPMETDFSCAVPSKEFYDVMRKSKSEEVTVKLFKSKLNVRAGKLKAQIITQEVGELFTSMSEEISSVRRWKSLPEGILTGLDLCRFSVAKDRGVLFNCIYIDKDYICSSDDLRVSYYKADKGVKDSFLVQSEAVNQLLAIEGVNKYFKGKSWIYFKGEGDVVFCIRLVNQEYPDVSYMFDVDDKEEIELPDGLRSVIDTVSVFSDGESNIDLRMEVEIGDGKLKCRGEKEVGWAEQIMDIDYPKKRKIKFVINPVFFSQVLSRTKTLIYGKDRALFTSDNFKHLMALYVDRD